MFIIVFLCYHDNMSDEHKNYLAALNNALNVSSDSFLQADAIVKITTPKTVDSSINTTALANYIEDFKFDWYNHDTDDYVEFASQAIEKIGQIVRDIKTGNDYHLVFSSEVAYGRIFDGEWLHTLNAKKMSAETIEQANLEIVEIRRNTVKTHPSKPGFTLDFVRAKYDALDQSNGIVLKDMLIPDEA